MSDQEKKREAIWDQLASVCESAGVDDAELIDALALDFLRKTWGPGDCGKLMAMLDGLDSGQVSVPLWRHISSPPADAFAREVPPGTVINRRLQKDRGATQDTRPASPLPKEI